ncbi:SDR family oxidoreductase [Ferrimonas sp. SCSIO 43195]|uniref:SDR family NAD(P)-dependent oxidoreductase n=1 Tax=Ferrimonas sp. SCSIO 43195 TaxID=2822844 RepID=UPI0020759992|nr:SDR family NAD(P)-dependent oxidoreductase [Ferrimonas sp. SCSIO 43195]USD36108.1 SDR family NAD(P)-dependent oxidoreductase [Ferrimonas sp. SCSIO 43195]
MTPNHSDSPLALISGASSGIGLDLAKAYAARGWRLALLARHPERLAQAVSQCQSLAPTAEVCGYSVDVDDAKAVQDSVAQIRAQQGQPQLLILSAGIVQSIPFLDQSDDEFEALMQTNLLGSRRLAKAWLPAMLEQPQGQICFVSSLAGLIAPYGYSGYSASKFALLGMAGALRQEVSPQGITVSVLCPPEVDTPMVAQERTYISPVARQLKDLGGTLQVDTVTRATLSGLEKGRFLIIPGFRAKLSYHGARLFPGLFGWAMQRIVNWASKRYSRQHQAR